MGHQEEQYEYEQRRKRKHEQDSAFFPISRFFPGYGTPDGRGVTADAMILRSRIVGFSTLPSNHFDALVAGKTVVMVDSADDFFTAEPLDAIVARFDRHRNAA